MSQETLAALADINRTHLSQLETGSKSVGLETVERLAVALKVSPADLVWLDPILVEAAKENEMQSVSNDARSKSGGGNS